MQPNKFDKVADENVVTTRKKILADIVRHCEGCINVKELLAVFEEAEIFDQQDNSKLFECLSSILTWKAIIHKHGTKTQ